MPFWHTLTMTGRSEQARADRASRENCVDSQHGEAPDSANEPEAIATGERRAEIGGPSGPEPTRFGDWERNGRCIDF